VEPDRTSPIANTPSTLVSNGKVRVTDSVPMSVPARQYKAFRIQRYAARPQPARIRLGAYEKEKMMSREASVKTVAPPIMDTLESFITFQCRNLCTGVDRHVRQRCNTLNQITGHAVLEIRATNEYLHMGDVGSEKNYRLSGRIAAADQKHRLVAAQPRFNWRRPIIAIDS
jgi:hypothetical protein